jgi:hypothetical protein
MWKFVRFVGKLPVPKDLRLSWQYNIIERSFRKKIKKLRTSKETDRNELKRIESSYQVEMSMINEERDEHYTKHLVRQARRLRVQVPNRIDDKGQPTSFWEEGHVLGRWYLTDVGISQIRNEIRKELKWRYERRSFYTTWATGIIGIIGAIIGFFLGILSHMLNN